jgi:hypothetical protein
VQQAQGDRSTETASIRMSAIGKISPKPLRKTYCSNSVPAGARPNRARRF